MIMQWTKVRPDIELQWMGPNKITNTAISRLDEITSKIAVIAGPKGADGKDGAPGVPGPPGPVTVVDGNVLIDTVDGGFF